MNDFIDINGVINKEWLQWYKDAWDFYNHLIVQKQEIQKRLTAVKAVDYSRDRVTNGSKSLSEQELFVMKLEKINSELAECEAILTPAKLRLKTEINRLNQWHWEKVLTLRYIEHYKSWVDVAREFFWFKEDFEEEKETKYKRMVVRWHQVAVGNLTKITSEMYISTEKQLSINDIEI